MKARLQEHWLPISECLARVAVLVPQDGAWPAVRDAIEDGTLRARGRCFGIDRQPLRPDWMRVAMWDDARYDGIFFREEKGPDLLPPQRVPPHVTNIEVCAADVERLWPETAGSDPGGAAGSRSRRRPSRELPFWGQARQEAVRRLQENGRPERGDGGQGRLERHILDWLEERGYRPVESTVRVHVRTWIDEYRANPLTD
jgi:hypothetical protein